MGKVGPWRWCGGDGFAHPGNCMSLTKNTLFKIGFGLLAAALLVTAVITTQSTNRLKSTALGAQTYLESTSTSQAENVNTVVSLPDFQNPESIIMKGISRLTSLDTTIPKRPSVDVTTYEVQLGDNLFMIAEKYSLRPETVLWGNYEGLRDNPQFLSPGPELTILPTDGVYYQWTAGDNLNSIASFFKVEPEVILDYPGNRLLPDMTNPTTPEIAAGTWLIIPGGKCELKGWGPPAITRANHPAARYYGEG